MTTVLAIDPGPTQSAYVLWDGESVSDHGIVDNETMLSNLRAIETVCAVDILAIEKIASYGMAVGESVFETCVWTGRFVQQWVNEGAAQAVCIQRIPRLDIKVHLCKTAKAKDANVRQALIDRFGAPGTKKYPGPLHGITSHCWAALAVAVCAFDRMKVAA